MIILKLTQPGKKITLNFILPKSFNNLIINKNTLFTKFIIY